MVYWTFRFYPRAEPIATRGRGFPNRCGVNFFRCAQMPKIHISTRLGDLKIRCGAKNFGWSAKSRWEKCGAKTGEKAASHLTLYTPLKTLSVLYKDRLSERICSSEHLFIQIILTKENKPDILIVNGLSSFFQSVPWSRGAPSWSRKTRPRPRPGWRKGGRASRRRWLGRGATHTQAPY